MDTKHQTRVKVTQLLKSNSIESLNKKSQDTCEKIFKWLKDNNFEQAKIAVFAALKTEINLEPLVQSLTEFKWFYPKCKGGNQLDFFRVKNTQEDLQSGMMGILEPKDHFEKMKIEDFDVIFCPGLAFDLQGNRLGRGGGYYDRSLVQVKGGSPKIVGVCFHEQVMKSLPTEAHDAKVHCVITEKGVVDTL